MPTSPLHQNYQSIMLFANIRQREFGEKCDCAIFSRRLAGYAAPLLLDYAAFKALD